MTNDYAEIFNKAADHIEKVGLYKGDFLKDPATPATTPCCTVGAIQVVRGRYNDNGTIAKEYDFWTEIDIEHALGDALGVRHIPAWNDKPSQRKGRVVKALRRAAKKLEAAA